MNSPRNPCPCGRREIFCLIFTSLLRGNMENRFGECSSRQLGEYSGLGWASAEADSHLLPKNEIESSNTGFLRAALQKNMIHMKQLCLAHQAIHTSQHQDKPVSGNIIFFSPTDTFVLHLGEKNQKQMMEWKPFPYRYAAGFQFPFVENPFSLSLHPPPTRTAEFPTNPRGLKRSELWQRRAARGGQQCKVEQREHNAGSWISDHPGTTAYSFHLEGRETKASLCVPGFCRN